MTEPYKLPPFIENRNGLYFNTLSQRWVGAYKIEKLCNDYWENKSSDPVIDSGNGAVVFKRGLMAPVKERKKRGFVKVIMEDPFYEPVIIPRNTQEIHKELVVTEPEIIENVPEMAIIKEIMVESIPQTNTENPQDEVKSMTMAEYIAHRSMGKSTFYFKREKGLIKFTDATNRLVDVVATDALLDQPETKKVKKSIPAKKITPVSPSGTTAKTVIPKKAVPLKTMHQDIACDIFWNGAGNQVIIVPRAPHEGCVDAYTVFVDAGTVRYGHPMGPLPNFNIATGEQLFPKP